MACINRNVMARWASPSMRADRANAYTRRFDRKANKCVMVRRERKGGREGGEREEGDRWQ